MNMLIASKSSMDTELYALTFEVSGMLIHIKHDAGAVLLRKMESKDLIGKEKRTHSFTDNEHNKITA